MTDSSSHFAIPASAEGSLHRADNERDACGVGFIAQIDGQRSNKILRDALSSCCNVVHRGAIDADQKTGDGAGVLTQIPHKLLLPTAIRLAGAPVAPQDLAVGVFYLPQDEAARLKVKIVAEGIIRQRGIRFLGWREVPVNVRELGEKARQTMPKIMHALLLKPEGLDAQAFERSLYIARREIERMARREDLPQLYIPSLSHRTISYKALLVAPALEKFYVDLQDPDYETAIALYHQRFSTNTFPSWPLSQPFRMLAHNGEINTVKGNRRWMASRESDFDQAVWGGDAALLASCIDPSASDSASLDQALELLVLSGRSVAEAMTLLVPPAWGIDPSTPAAQRALFEYNAGFAEPWDGPAGLVYTDGLTVAANLDRNGLRPSRFKLTEDGHFSLGSEVGVVDVPEEKVVRKGRLAPGQMVAVDTTTGRVLFNDEIKAELAARHPYADWLAQHRVPLAALPAATCSHPQLDPLALSQQQVAFGYTKEEIDMVLTPMLEKAEEAVYSMGDDAPLSVLSTRPRLLYTYFKQLFAQVTNPPIDPIRERGVMEISVSIGWKRNLLEQTPEHAELLHLESPFLLEDELATLLAQERFPHQTIDCTWPVAEGAAGLEAAVTRVCQQAADLAAPGKGTRILVLSDRNTSATHAPIPALIATGAIHHHLNQARRRMRVSLVVETAEARDTHQMACLFGYGASAICPYLAFSTIAEILESDALAKKPKLAGLALPEATYRYRKALEKGVLKIMSKMGISVLASYQGAQIFEAVGVGADVISRCFTGTHSRIGGISFSHIAEESLARHREAFPAPAPESALTLEDPGYFRPRREGETHAISAPVLKNFHKFVRSGDPEAYRDYLEEERQIAPIALKDLFEFVPASSGPIPLEEVESIEDIRVRFTTAAMSLGAISPEAHEALAIAMNRIGGKSDSGEGGEDAARFNTEKNSKIKQIASGRFGVSAEYLVNAEELEIKMAQGAKPGEGGQLPGHKVNGLIARLRHTVPGVTLISPPPHHDIYSIEDLAQLIHDLKEVNPRARVCVKLVAESGVGTVAAGVAKANADIILVSGHDGGTGASPLSSIKHAGLPWEMGLSETQQVLMLNGLRDRVTLRTDGGFRHGRDIVMGAILGAEEFNFGTIALIALGCVYVRQCHLNTCPVGVATQDERLRQKFKGDPEHVINFFNAVADEARAIMAQLGVRRMNDLIGRTRYLRTNDELMAAHPKANTLDLSPVLRDVAREAGEEMPRRCLVNRNDGLHPHPLDDRIIQQAHGAIKDGTPTTLSYRVRNTNRNVGTKLSGEVAFQHGNHGLPEGTITIQLEGSAGQSFGTFLCGGIRLILTGEANDYVGKGMAAGEIVIKPSPLARFDSWENSIMGNTVRYGATGGQLFAAGRAGERFCVRNSGGTAVVEGIGDHGCEYMTGGTIAILGRFGKNFGAGMSGGTAYLFDENATFAATHNPEMIKGEPVAEPEDENELRHLVQAHLEKTGSARAQYLLDNWATTLPQFIKASPKSTPAPEPAPEPDPQPAAG